MTTWAAFFGMVVLPLAALCAIHWYESKAREKHRLRRRAEDAAVRWGMDSEWVNGPVLRSEAYPGRPNRHDRRRDRKAYWC